MAEEKQHALLSASGAHRWMTCTPSARLEENFPSRQTQYTLEGTLAHALAELKLRKTYEAMSTKKYNGELKKIKELELYKPEMDTHTDTYAEFIKSIMYTSKAPYINIEYKTDFSKYVPEGFGTTDCVIIEGETLHVIDFKYGQGVPVSAENNPQMMLYALGIHEANSIIYNINKIKLSIVQPRLDSISEWEISAEDLLKWGEEVVKQKAEEAFAGIGEFVPGEHCRFCKAKGQCKARAEINMQAVEIRKTTDSKLLSNEEIGIILKECADVEDWLKDMKEIALNKILEGEKIEGWKVVEGRSNRVITDIDEAFEKLKNEGFEEAVLYERKPLSLTELEKLVGKKKFGELMADYIDKPKGKPALVESSDKRADYIVGTTVEEDFSDSIPLF